MTTVSITRKIDVRDPNVVPAWVPAAGTFANISTNTLASARPPGWPSNDIAGPFANWAGGVYCADFGSSGGYAVHGSGHLSAGSSLWAGVWVFDLASLAWVGRNVPSQPLIEGGAMNAYAEYTDSAVVGHTYPPHTYDGLVYQPSAQGGGSSGALIRVGVPGASIAGARCVHRFDLSSATLPPTRVINDLASVSTSYPATAYDAARNGFWAISNNGAGSLGFVSFADWSVTTYPATFNVYGDASIVYVPSRDCLVAIHRVATDVSQVGVLVCPIVNNVPQGWTAVTQSGTAPTDSRCGGVWSTLLGQIVCYAGIASYASNRNTGLVVSRLSVPENLVSGTWQWTAETLTGVNGAVPTISLDGNGAFQNNGTWSRFVEVPNARCFLFAGSVNGPVQAWRLTGM